MYLFFEKVMRVGVSYIFRTYSKGSNTYLTSSDPKKIDEIYYVLRQKIIYMIMLSQNLFQKVNLNG